MFSSRSVGWACALAFSLSACGPVFGQHAVWLHGGGKLLKLDREGKIAWELSWGGIHDLHVLPNGNVMVQEGAAKVVEIDVATKKVVWRYDAAAANPGKPVEVHAFQPLEGGRLMVAESGPGRIVEVDRDGKTVHEIKLKVDRPHPHTDTRLARKLENGGYLVAHEGDGFVREYSAKGEVVWEYDVPLFGEEPRGGHGPEAFGDKCFAAIRLADGDTLIATGNGHSVLRVNRDKEIVWQIRQKDLPGIVLAWVTTLQTLSNGNYLIGNCHAGKGQPLLIEIEPKTKKVVWKLDRWDDFGNDVSNSLAVE